MLRPGWTNGWGLLEDDGGDALLSSFLSLRGVVKDLPTPERVRLLVEIHKGYQNYLNAALAYNASFDQYELDQPQPARTSVGLSGTPALEATEAYTDEAYTDTVAAYLAEGQRGNQWAAKTFSEKQDALDLLGQVTGHKAFAQLTKADARKVKATLLTLPKNRSKNPAIRHMPLQEMLTDTTVPKIASRTVNSYLSALQSFAAWSVNNGYESPRFHRRPIASFHATISSTSRCA